MSHDSPICPATGVRCARLCANGRLCEIVSLKAIQPKVDLEAKDNYFIQSHRLGAIESVAKAMLNNSNKRARRVELNHIQQVLKTLHLIPHSAKVIALGLGCLDTGESGLFVLCNSPHQISADLPTLPSNERKPSE